MCMFALLRVFLMIFCALYVCLQNIADELDSNQYSWHGSGQRYWIKRVRCGVSWRFLTGSVFCVLLLTNAQNRVAHAVYLLDSAFHTMNQLWFNPFVSTGIAFGISLQSILSSRCSSMMSIPQTLCCAPTKINGRDLGSLNGIYLGAYKLSNWVLPWLNRERISIERFFPTKTRTWGECWHWNLTILGHWF